MSPVVVLEAEGLTKSFGGLRAVQGMSFVVRTGELVALAELLALVGLDGFATRAARLAMDAPTEAQVAELRRRLDRRLGLRTATDGVGWLGLTGLSGDVTARWRRWLDRAAAVAAGQEVPEPEPLDTADLGDALVGMEVGAALLAMASVRPELAASAVAEVAT